MEIWKKKNALTTKWKIIFTKEDLHASKILDVRRNDEKSQLLWSDFIDSFKDLDSWTVERNCDKIERLEEKFGMKIEQDGCVLPQKYTYGNWNYVDQTVCFCFSDLCNNSETIHFALKTSMWLCTLILFYANIEFILHFWLKINNRFSNIFMKTDTHSYQSGNSSSKSIQCTSLQISNLQWSPFP